MLALDNMLYLAKVHQDTYIRVKAGQGSPSLLVPIHAHLPLTPTSSLLVDCAGEQQSGGQT